MHLKFSHLMPLSVSLLDTIQINDERFIATEETLSCSCQQYEFSGILCRHAIRVLVAANVFQIPDKYIPMRWCRESSLPCRNKVSNPIRCNEVECPCIKSIKERGMVQNCL
ncbi:hypothetical protein AMTRI_Chr07g29100 [Amborella trichopoda]